MPMPMHDAAPLLSLLGHELRAPAGVLGGYLALIDRGAEHLTADQQQAVAGARRAQQRLVEILDEASRLVASWKAEAAPVHAVGLAPVFAEVRATAAAQDLELSADLHLDESLRVRAPRAALVEAIVSISSAVAREHGSGVRLTVARAEPGGAVVHIRAAAAGGPATELATVTEPFNLWRPGLGLSLVVAATVLADAGARLDEVIVDGGRVGVDIAFGGSV